MVSKVRSSQEGGVGLIPSAGSKQWYLTPATWQTFEWVYKLMYDMDR